MHLLMITRGGRDYSSSRVRAMDHRPALADAGIRTWAPYNLPWRSSNLFGLAIARLGAYACAPFADCIWLQKRALPQAYMKWLQHRGIRVLFDLDDAIYLRNWPWVEAMIRQCDLVLCGSPEILAYCTTRNTHAYLLPTCVDTELFAPASQQHDGPVVLGWTGSKENLPYLESLSPALLELERKYGPRVALHVMCNQRPNLPGVTFLYRSWTRQDEPLFVQRFDIGLMPLTDDPWSRAKCAYKAILSMAVGAPPIVSPVGANRVVVRPEIDGLYATTPHEWYTTLSALIEDDERRHIMGKTARNRALDSYSYHVYRDELIHLLRGTSGER